MKIYNRNDLVIYGQLMILLQVEKNIAWTQLSKLHCEWRDSHSDKERAQIMRVLATIWKHIMYV